MNIYYVSKSSSISIKIFLIKDNKEVLELINNNDERGLALLIGQKLDELTEYIRKSNILGSTVFKTNGYTGYSSGYVNI